MKVFVIGGGASGMAAAITSSRCGNDVTIIEKNNNLGKKILLTGNGRCNYFNADMDLSNFHSNGDVSKFINEKNIDKLTKFYDSLGIIPRIKDGYYYPYSNTATAIHSSLLKEIENLGIKIINEELIDLKKENKFIIVTNVNSYECDKIILSTGGITYSKTGSNGFGYDILRKMGHNLVEPKAALVPLKSSGKLDWAGIRCNVKAELYVDKLAAVADSSASNMS